MNVTKGTRVELIEEIRQPQMAAAPLAQGGNYHLPLAVLCRGTVGSDRRNTVRAQLFLGQRLFPGDQALEGQMPETGRVFD